MEKWWISKGLKLCNDSLYLKETAFLNYKDVSSFFNVSPTEVLGLDSLVSVSLLPFLNTNAEFLGGSDEVLPTSVGDTVFSSGVY